MTALAAVRRHPGLVTALLAAAGLTWWWTVQRMAGMDAGPGTGLGTLGWFTGSWVLMMAAMMLPSFAPTLAGYLAPTHRRGGGRWPLLVCGYLLAWAVAGLVAYAAFEAGRSLLRGELSWQGDGGWLSGGVILEPPPTS